MVKKEWNILIKKINKQNSIIDQILLARGIKSKNKFLNPKESDLIDLNLLSNIDKALDVVLNGIRSNKRFSVLADTDQDGCCSGAIMYRYLKNYTNNVEYRINSGKIHGLSGQNLESYIDNIDIIIAVDSLSCEYDKYEYLNNNGIKVILLDHHPSEGSKCATIVNSQLNDYPNKFLSGSGVVWKFCKYIDEKTGNEYADDYIDLAATGIIADVMDISENNLENRYICQKGLNNLVNPGLKGIVGKYVFNGQCVGWSIAPLTNAAQRTNNNELAFKLFISDDKKEIKKIIEELKLIKTQENEVALNSMSNLEFQIKSNECEKNKIISGFIVEGSMSGLIANKIADKYSRPSIILKQPDNEDSDEYSGSIRGFGIDNFRSLINSTKLAVASGHESASGITIKKENYEKLIKELNKRLENVEFKITQNADVSLKLDDIDFELIEELDNINLITGKGFESVKIVLNDIEVENLTTMQNKHLKFNFGNLEFVMWNGFNNIKDFESEIDSFRIVDVLGSLCISNFRGRKAMQFVISDYRNSREELEFLRA